jgi:DASS family divalent anion:Na+ symporter
VPPAGLDRPALRPGLAWVLIVGLGAAIWLAAAWSEGRLVPGWDWRLLAIFLPTILALMLRPLPGGAAVWLAILATVLVGALPLDEALAGYRDPTVWLVLAAYFLARAFIKTGLARRIALTFVRLLGRSTLGLSYALLASDTLLAGMIPSNAARVGGVLLPITRSLAELYQSHPGRTAPLLGSFLMLALYQGDVVASALFLTGQASNPLAAQQAARLTEGLPGGPVVLSYGTWLWYALFPALTSLLLIPWLLYRWERPSITHTPAAAAFARAELVKMGVPKRDEGILIGVFAGVCTLWIFLGAGATTLVALSGVGILLLAGVLTWEDAVAERGAWDVFIWYGGLLQLGKQLEKAGLTARFAQTVVGALGEGEWAAALLLGELKWLPLFLITLLIYFYAHYAFASITAHLVAMYPAFVAVLIAAGAPAALVVSCFAFFANFSAGLTHYGTTPAPIIFSLGYVSQRGWWRVGFWLSLVNVTVWLLVGMTWWKLLGLW